MDFGDDRVVQANINQKFVLTGRGSVDEPQFWNITWNGGNNPGYHVNKKMRHN